MNQQIINALNAIHSRLERSAGMKLPYMATTLSDLLEEMGLPRNSVPVGFHDALEDLASIGEIDDLSTSNGGFGRNVGTDGDITYSNGAKVTLR